MRRLPAVWGLLLFCGVSACREPVAPGGCALQLASGCWTFEGLRDETITALGRSSWGTFAGTFADGVFRQTTGTRWQRSGLDIPHGYISALLYTPTLPGRILAAIGAKADSAGTNDTQAAVYASEDGGRSWYPWDGGLDARAAARGDDAWATALAMDPGDASRLYLGLSYPIMRSEDGGRDWQYIWGNDDIFGGGIVAFLIAPDRSGRMWAVGTTGYLHGAVLRSADWGNSWKFTDPTPTFDNTIGAIVLDPRGSGRLVAGAGGGVMVSDDSGASWHLTLTTSGCVCALAAVGDVIFAASSENAAFPPEGGPPTTDLGLYRTRDAGITWDTLAVPAGSGGAGAILAGSSGDLFIGTQHGSGGAGVWRFQPSAGPPPSAMVRTTHPSP